MTNSVKLFELNGIHFTLLLKIVQSSLFGFFLLGVRSTPTFFSQLFQNFIEFKFYNSMLHNK